MVSRTLRAEQRCHRSSTVAKAETATGSGLVSRRTANGYQSSRTIMIWFAYGRTNRLTLSIGLFER